MTSSQEQDIAKGEFVFMKEATPPLISHNQPQNGDQRKKSSHISAFSSHDRSFRFDEQYEELSLQFVERSMIWTSVLEL
jgi:hypothetical protein